MGFLNRFTGGSSPEKVAVKQAKRRAEGLRQQLERELAPKTKALRAAEREHEKRVKSIEAELRLFRDPGKGRQLGHLDHRVTLYEHVLSFKVGFLEEHTYPLDGLRVRLDGYAGSTFMYIELPDGRSAVEGMNFEGVGNLQIEKFGAMVRNAILAEQQFRGLLPQAIANTERMLLEAQNDTTQITQAQIELNAAERTSVTWREWVKATAEYEVALQAMNGTASASTSDFPPPNPNLE